jgi:hypothetical protein
MAQAPRERVREVIEGSVTVAHFCRRRKTPNTVPNQMENCSGVTASLMMVAER